MQPPKGPFEYRIELVRATDYMQSYGGDAMIYEVRGKCLDTKTIAALARAFADAIDPPAKEKGND